MKKLSFGVVCALGILGTGCDMEIPNDQLGQLSAAELCTLSGGEFNEAEKTCYCGGVRCGENVTCGVDEASNKYVCMTAGNMDYPQYTCTLQGMTLCFDRIVNLIDENGIEIRKTFGYYVYCNGTSWETPAPCRNNYSCSTYLEHDVFYATECGECNNNDTECIRGTIINKQH